MRRLLWIGLAASFVGVLLTAALATRGEQPVILKTEAPEFKDVAEWINSKPLLMKDLRGKVVVVHFWTFG